MPTPTRPTALVRSPRFLDHDTGDHVKDGFAMEPDRGSHILSSLHQPACNRRLP